MAKSRTLGKVAVGDVITNTGSKSYVTPLAVGESATVARTSGGTFVELYDADDRRILFGSSTSRVQVSDTGRIEDGHR